MESLKGTQTEKNLLAAFAGESQARNRYTYYAKVAKKEGYNKLEELFLETADNEKQHAKTFFKFLEGGMVEPGPSAPPPRTSRRRPRERTRSGPTSIPASPTWPRRRASPRWRRPSA